MMVLYIWMCDKIQTQKESRCVKVIKHTDSKKTTTGNKTRRRIPQGQ
jgi:hypothetical protein